jgi:hypothetical protein
MIDDTPQPATTPTPTTSPPVGDAPEKKKVKKDVPGFRLDKRATVTIQELCADLKINCTVARKKLREAGIQKCPYGNYEWEKSSPEYKKVRKLLTAA